MDEWNVWDPRRALGVNGAEECYTLSDSLAVAIWLNIFIRNCKDLGMATIAQSVNVISPLMTTPKGVYKQTTYWPLLLFSKYMQGKSVAVSVRTPEYTGVTHPEWVQSTCVVPKLDVSAAIDGQWMNLAVVNSDADQNLETSITGLWPASGEDVEVHVVGGEASNLTDVNTEGSETISIRQSSWAAQPKFVFEKHSFTLLRWKV